MVVRTSRKAFRSLRTDVWLLGEPDMFRQKKKQRSVAPIRLKSISRYCAPFWGIVKEWLYSPVIVSIIRLVSKNCVLVNSVPLLALALVTLKLVRFSPTRGKV